MPPSGYDARPTTDWYGQRVVSTADHAMVLREIVAHVPRSGNFRLFDATLVLEIDNPQASSGYAVSVRWQSQVLGYLPDSDIEPYFPELARLAASGVDAVVKARLWTNMDDPSHTPGSEEFTVTVGVQPAGEIVPLNDPPLAQWVLIPRGTAITAITDRQIFKVAKTGIAGIILLPSTLLLAALKSGLTINTLAPCRLLRARTCAHSWNLTTSRGLLSHVTPPLMFQMCWWMSIQPIRKRGNR